MKRFMIYAKNHKGVSLVIMSIFLVVLLIFASLAIDIAYMYFAKNQLQVAADAAALAGAAKLDATNVTALIQEPARQQAWKFACQNKAAGSPIFLVTNIDANGGSNCDLPPPAANLNSANAADGDIVVGNWDKTTRQFSTDNISTTKPINAIQITARRTGETPGMDKVGLFLGKIFQLIGTDWSVMAVRASAIAARPPRPTSGIVLCDPVCQTGFDLSQPFSLQEQSGPYSVSWTEYELTPPIGTATCLRNTNRCDNGLDDNCATADNKTVASFIWQMNLAPVGCMRMVWANGLAGVRFDIKCAFESMTFDTDYKTDAAGNTPPIGPVDVWKVIVPISPVCPSGGTPGQGPYDITKFAEIEIDDVIGPTPQAIMIRSIHCVPCDEWYVLGNKPKLVQ